MIKFKHMKVTGLALLMAMSVLGTAACGGSTTSSQGELKVRVVSYEGGFGVDWLDEAAARFKTAYASNLPEGKTLKIDIVHTKTPGTENMGTSADDMYFVNDGVPTSLAQKGWLADIDDIVTEKVDGKSIEDKIDVAERSVLKGKVADQTGDHYVALPYASYSMGLSYDIDFFTKNNCFIAADDETNVNTHTMYGLTVKFAKDGAKKSKGIDNKEGTEDDGLPVSMQEFLVLCDYIKNECDGSPSPVHYAGAQAGYVNDFINAVETSLSGYDEMLAERSFSGQIECVKMTDGKIQLTGTDIFDGIDYVEIPEHYTADLSDADAHLTTQTLSRYYADALVYILHKEDYFSKKSAEGTSTNLQGQEEFLLSGRNQNETMAMFIEGSYWMTEAEENDAFDVLKMATGETSRNIGWMPLPVVVNKADYDPSKHQQTMEESGRSFCFINANTQKNKPEIFEVCKDFMQFLYSDEELSLYTGSCGLMKRSLEYTVQEADRAKMTFFANNVMKNVESSKIIGLTSTNSLFLKYSNNLTGASGIKVMPNIKKSNGQTEHFASVIGAYRDVNAYDLYTVYESTVAEKGRFI